ncbi:MAG: hypothetical protein ABI472_05405 [Ginsengibacter sp.]
MRRVIAFIFSTSMVCSCYSPRYVYSPPTQNIPLLHNKNDVELSAFYGGSVNAFKEKGNYNRGFDIHTAWAMNKHFAGMLNESVRWEKNGGNDSFFPRDSSFLSYKRNFTEIGAGYFSSVQHNDKMQFQVFGGAAFGSSKIFDDYISSNVHVDKYHNSRVTKIFIQPAVIYSPVVNLSAALSTRFTQVIFTRIHTNYTQTELDNYILDSLTVSPVFFWEPAVSYTFGFKKIPVKLRIEASISVLINHRFVEHRTGNIGVGIVTDFSKKKKSKATSAKS